MTQIGKPPCDDAVVHAGPSEAAACPPASRRWVLVATILASSMAFVDGTMVNVALPAIRRDLQATLADAQWVVESYALFLAALLLVGGSLGDRFGRRRVFLIGVARVRHRIARLRSGVDGRPADRGACAAGHRRGPADAGQPRLISAAFPEAERGRAIGTWSGFSGITAAVGPVFGGFLVDHYSWAWAFLINLPLAVAVVLISRKQCRRAGSAPIADRSTCKARPARHRRARRPGVRADRGAGRGAGRRRRCWPALRSA